MFFEDNWDKQRSPLKYSPSKTFVLMKMSFVFVFRRRLDQDEYIRVIHIFSEDQDQYISLGLTSSRRLQDVFKTFPRRLLLLFTTPFAKTSSRHLQDVFKTPLRHLQDILQRSLQDVFKTYYQVKLFLLTRFET